MKPYETPEYKITVSPAPETAKEADCEMSAGFLHFCLGAGMLAIMILTWAAGIAVAALCGGCASESAKVVEGTDLSVGFSLPMAEGESNFTIFNYLSGFKTSTSERSQVKLWYSCAETNDYFGIITTRTAKRVRAEIMPVVEEEEEEEGESAASADAPESPEAPAAPEEPGE